MNNIQKLAKDGGKNHRLFVSTIIQLKSSQGFYCRLYQNVNDMDTETYESLFNLLKKQDFKDNIDVILWLES